jgi:hypothetical protein
VPHLERPEKAEPYRDQIVTLFQQCRGNLVRVHEELIATGVALSYPALTAFCRRHGIGHAPPSPVGHYDFAMGQEMQHDTSPHRASIGGVEQPVQTASLVLCYSRLLFIQMYPAFTRFTCKVFLTDALQYVTGACTTCMIDNTHVVVASGTGARMVAAPEMAAFAERFRFTFRAHEKGDANRSGRVERPFWFVETNFLAGRTFTDFADLNAQARTWCNKVNATYKDHLHASPRELFVAERAQLQPLPLFIPEVYALHHRLVDVEGYVNVQGHRYSVPYLLSCTTRVVGATFTPSRGARIPALGWGRRAHPPLRLTAAQHATGAGRAPPGARRSPGPGLCGGAQAPEWRTRRPRVAVSTEAA